jgi:hypothetical protein
MVRDLSAERRSLLNKLPTNLAAGVERNCAWMDTFGGDRGLAALTQANKEEEEAKACEPVVQEEKEEEEKSYSPPALKWHEQHPNHVQQELPVDAMYCGFCLVTPCLYSSSGRKTY